MKLKFDVTAQEFSIIKKILDAHLPPHCSVWVFGSRTKNSARFNSDLDLAIDGSLDGKERIDEDILMQLGAALEEAPLAFSVDLLDIHAVEPYFRKIIDAQKVPFRSNEPRLRFPEFSGVWEEKKGNEIFTNISNKNHDRNLPILAITQNHGAIPRDLIDYKMFVTNASISSYKTVEIGDFIISLRSFQGGIEYSNYRGICSAAYIILRSTIEICDYFYKYYLKTHNHIQELNRKLEGIRDGKMISFKYFSEIKLPYPSLPEQEKIASFLSTVDHKIEQLVKKLALLGDYKKGLMQKIFTQEIRFRADDGSNFPDWEEKKLGEVADIVGGGTPKTAEVRYWGGSIQWFTPTEIKTKYVSNSKKTITELGLKNSSAKMLPKGTLLLSTRATIGYIGIATQKCTTNQGCKSLITKCEHNNEFLYYYLSINKKNLINQASGSTFLEISKASIAQLKLHLPSLPEQEKIASFLSSMDNRIELVRKQLETTKQFKKGLLQQMFV